MCPVCGATVVSETQKRCIMSVLAQLDEVATEEEILDPNDSEMEWDLSRGQTKVHAVPPRLEDEGQSGG
jgi:hypothetical protein